MLCDLPSNQPAAVCSLAYGPQQRGNVQVLLDGAGIAQVRQRGLLAGALLDLAVELRPDEQDHAVEGHPISHKEAEKIGVW